MIYGVVSKVNGDGAFASKEEQLKEKVLATGMNGIIPNNPVARLFRELEQQAPKYN